MYGFGAAAREDNCAQKRRNTHILSFLAAALCTAVSAVMVAISPVDPATASPLLNQAESAPSTLGVAAIAAFALSTVVCALTLAVSVLASRKSSHQSRL